MKEKAQDQQAWQVQAGRHWMKVGASLALLFIQRANAKEQTLHDNIVVRFLGMHRALLYFDRNAEVRSSHGIPSTLSRPPSPLPHSFQRNTPSPSLFSLHFLSMHISVVICHSWLFLVAVMCAGKLPSSPLPALLRSRSRSCEFLFDFLSPFLFSRQALLS